MGNLEIHKLQMMAGFTSGIIFMTGSLPMLLKAFKTKDLRSYSVVQLALSNFGNVLYWLYLASLPVGPIWFLQGFTTVSSALMLIFYLRYERRRGGFRARAAGVEQGKPRKEGMPTSQEILSAIGASRHESHPIHTRRITHVNRN